MTSESDISDEVSETAKAVQDVDKALGSPMSLLLGPTFKLIGEHWGKKTDSYLNPKQVENLEEKIAIAQQDGPLLLGNDTSPRQVAGLIEWTDAARTIDSKTEPLLSAAWILALKDISKKNYLLLDALSKLDESDLHTLQERDTFTRLEVAKFTELGLIEPIDNVRKGAAKREFVRLILFGLLMAPLIALGYGAVQSELLGISAVLGLFFFVSFSILLTIMLFLSLMSGYFLWKRGVKGIYTVKKTKLFIDLLKALNLNEQKLFSFDVKEVLSSESDDES
jgi:hypothetical protein